MKNLRLKNVPKDVKEIILKTQLDLRLKCNCIKSQETTIYHLIRKAYHNQETEKE